MNKGRINIKKVPYWTLTETDPMWSFWTLLGLGLKYCFLSVLSRTIPFDFTVCISSRFKIRSTAQLLKVKTPVKEISVRWKTYRKILLRLVTNCREIIETDLLFQFWPFIGSILRRKDIKTDESARRKAERSN